VQIPIFSKTKCPALIYATLIPLQENKLKQFFLLTQYFFSVHALDQGCPAFLDKEPQSLLWAGSWAASLKITTIGTPNRLNKTVIVYSKFVIYVW
jgi:hypothetical protein